jgi:integrase
MAAIYKTSRGYGVDWRDEFGRRQRRFVGSIEAANAVRAKLEESTAIARAAFRNLAACDLTWHEATQAMLASQVLAPNTRQRFKETLHRAGDLLGNPKATEVTPLLLARWQQARQPQVSQNTFSTEARAVQHLFRWLEESSFIVSSPARGLDTRTVKSDAARAITYPEEAQLLQCATPRVRLRLLLALDAGLRRSEVLALRKNHLGWADNLLTVHSQKTRTVRHVPMTARLRAALQQATQGLAADALVCNIAGHRLRPQSAADFMRSLSQRAQVRCRYHDLRHTFATRLSAVEPNPFVLALLLGHTIRTTTAMYIHPTPVQLAQAVRGMEAANPNCQGENP